jgi:hypothetical protein
MQRRDISWNPDTQRHQRYILPGPYHGEKRSFQISASYIDVNAARGFDTAEKKDEVDDQMRWDPDQGDVIFYFKNLSKAQVGRTNRTLRQLGSGLSHQMVLPWEPPADSLFHEGCTLTLVDLERGSLTSWYTKQIQENKSGSAGVCVLNQ